MKKRKKIKKKALISVIFFILIIGIILYLVFKSINENKLKSAFVGSDSLVVNLYDEKEQLVKEIIRGEKIKVYFNTKSKNGYIKIKYNNDIYYVKSDNVVYNEQDIVFEKEIYVRTSYNMMEDPNSIKLLGLLQKGDKLTVIGYDYLNNDGSVNMYKVTTANDKEGYFYQKYVTYDHESSLENYDSEGIYKIHASKKNKLGGGDGGSLDYYPVIKPIFENNSMPNNVYALYLNGTKGVISKVDDYIAFAKTTKINAFVVDIKDSGVSAYASPIMQEYSATSYKYAQNSFDNYKNAIKKIKEAGFYVIGRITTFKDDYYVADHKEYAISDASGNALKHQSSYWPSAYKREVWEYNVLLAKEAVTEMGFNEIQFDYVRFPDGLKTREDNKTVNYKNAYNETKAQAIQRFLMYACNELHKLKVYVSADVFGESSWGYVSSYGQYWPAISNVVDVISAMPYTDHFDRDDSSYWTKPYNTLLTWGKTASARQKEIPTPAIARTWITAYDTPYWKPTVIYNGERISDQVTGLYDAGLTGGYMTWNNASNLNKYKSQITGYNKEYK